MLGLFGVLILFCFAVDGTAVARAWPPQHRSAAAERRARDFDCRAFASPRRLGARLGLFRFYLLGEALPWPLSSLAAYFDGRGTGRREHAQSDADTRFGAQPATGGKMTEQEAYQILGVEPGASAEEISHAHRALMKKVHPDQGGTTYLAARINEAKDVLLRNHR